MNDLPEAILDALEATPLNGRVLLLGDAAQGYQAALTTHRPDLNVASEAHDTLKPGTEHAQRYDLGIMVDLQAWGDRTVLEHQLATLRDVLCKQLWVGVTPGGAVPFSRADSLALGLKQAPTEYGKSVARNWYKYSIIHYKRAPDWLNSDNWAHPERWNKERWRW